MKKQILLSLSLEDKIKLENAAIEYWPVLIKSQDLLLLLGVSVRVMKSFYSLFGVWNE